MRQALLILVLLCIGCAENKTKAKYIQQQEINLTQPRVEATSTMIDSSVVVTADFQLEGSELYYTNDGTEPDESSPLYSTPLTVSKEGLYRFKAFHNDWSPSDVSELKIYEKGEIPNTIDWETQASTTYPGLGNTTAFNHKKGSLNFRDEQWIGFDTIAKANLSFEETHVKKISISYLIDTKSWIFPPSEVVVYINKNDSIQVTIPKLDEADELKALRDVTIPVDKKITSISIAVKNTEKLPEWHPGSGLKAWLFMDEWIFN